MYAEVPRTKTALVRPNRIETMGRMEPRTVANSNSPPAAKAINDRANMSRKRNRSTPPVLISPKI